jgi:hypothetical protein
VVEKFKRVQALSQSNQYLRQGKWFQEDNKPYEAIQMYEQSVSIENLETFYILSKLGK